MVVWWWWCVRLWSRRRKQLLSTLSESYAEELRQGHQQAMRCRELFVSITKVSSQAGA